MTAFVVLGLVFLQYPTTWLAGKIVSKVTYFLCRVGRKTLNQLISMSYITTIVLRPFVWTTRVSRYQKKHSPICHPDHHPIYISFFHLPRSIASSLFKLCTWQSFCTTSFHVFFGLPLGLEPSTSYSIHFFTQSYRYIFKIIFFTNRGLLLVCLWLLC